MWRKNRMFDVVFRISFIQNKLTITIKCSMLLCRQDKIEIQTTRVQWQCTRMLYVFVYFYTILYKQQREMTTFWVFKRLLKFPEMY